MAKIHGIAYILIGLLVVIASWKINYSNLILFFYIGWIFVLVGMVKLMLGFGKKKDKPQQNAQSRNLSHLTSQGRQHQAHHYKKCPRCHNVMRVHDRFCGRCGYRV
ncbi:zinc ribbon domain-containing protein [Candidatus Woesearchaeota archaeon]|nr:zinc ribbon domain-containing protein [Candidatus Woesearchaeota archaeon]